MQTWPKAKKQMWERVLGVMSQPAESIILIWSSKDVPFLKKARAAAEGKLCLAWVSFDGVSHFCVVSTDNKYNQNLFPDNDTDIVNERVHTGGSLQSQLNSKGDFKEMK